MILILTQCFPPVTGGMENLMGGLARTLAAMGHQVTVLADGKGGKDEQDHDRACPFPVRRFGGPRPWRRLRKRVAAARLTAGGGIEAIFADSWKSAATALETAEKTGVPLIALAHGNDILTQGDAARAARIRKVLSRVHRVAANSAYTARQVQALGVPAERIRVVHPGVEPPPDPSPAMLAEADRLFDGFEHRLLTLARLEPRKGHDQVIRCLPELARHFPGVGYVVAGDGPDRARLAALARELGIEERVRFAGRVSDELKSALFERADLFVMPVREDSGARSVEGFGIAYVEAAFRGLPAVAGRSGGVPDAVIDGETGRLCEGTDTAAVCTAIRELLADPAQRARLGEAARHRARDFLWTTAGQRYLDLLSDDHPVPPQAVKDRLR